MELIPISDVKDLPEQSFPPSLPTAGCTRRLRQEGLFTREPPPAKDLINFMDSVNCVNGDVDLFIALVVLFQMSCSLNWTSVIFLPWDFCWWAKWPEVIFHSSNRFGRAKTINLQNGRFGPQLWILHQAPTEPEQRHFHMQTSLPHFARRDRVLHFQSFISTVRMGP